MFPQRPHHRTAFSPPSVRMGTNKMLGQVVALPWQQQRPFPVQGQTANHSRLLIPVPLLLVLRRLPLALLLPLLLQLSHGALSIDRLAAAPAAGQKLLCTKQLRSSSLLATWALNDEKFVAAGTPAAARTVAAAARATSAAATLLPTAALAAACHCNTTAALRAATVCQDAASVGRTSASTTAPEQGTSIRKGATTAPKALAAVAAKDGEGGRRERKGGVCATGRRQSMRSFAAEDASRRSSISTAKGVPSAVIAAAEVRQCKPVVFRQLSANNRASCTASFLILPHSSSSVRKTFFSASSPQVLPGTTRFCCPYPGCPTHVPTALGGVAAASSASAPAVARSFCYIGSVSVPRRPRAGASHYAVAARRIRVCTTFPAAPWATADTVEGWLTSAPAATSAGGIRAGTKIRITFVAAAHPVTAAQNNVASTVAAASPARAAPADGSAVVAREASTPAALAAGENTASAGAAATHVAGAPAAKSSLLASGAAVLRAVGVPGSKSSTGAGASATAGDRLLGAGGRENTTAEAGAQEASVASAGIVSRSRVARSVTPVALRALRPVVKGRVSPERPVPSCISLPFYALHDDTAAAALREMQYQQEQQQRREEALQLRTRLAKHLPISTREIEWVKTSKEIEGVRRACTVAAAVLQKAVDFVRDAAEAAAAGELTTDAIDAVVHAAALDYGAYPSPLRYSSFPKSVCTSVNEVICHGIPDDAVLQEGSICSIDVSCYIGGFHGDCARTVTIGRPGSASAPVLQLVAAAEEATLRGIAACGPGKRLSVVGDAIESFLSSRNYRTIPHFCGHGIGRSFHEEPFIIHVPNSMPGRMLPGMCFTVEPVVCSGGAEYKTWDDKWTVSSLDGAPSAQFEHTVLITDTGVEILTPYPGPASVCQAASSSA